MSTEIATVPAAAFADLRGRVALVTGGNAGIGLGMATGLARAGAAVAIWGTNQPRNAAAVDALAAEQPEGEVAAFAVDVADETAVNAGIAALVERFGRLDSCFANAGITGPPAPIEEVGDDIWRPVLAVNLDGLMFTLRAASRQLRRQGDGGALVVTSSIGSLHGMARHAAYAATKGAAAAVVRALAVELARDEITVNAILPGWIDTAITAEVLASESARGKILPRIPMRRWGTPDDFEATAVLLAGPGARYITRPDDRDRRRLHDLLIDARHALAESAHLRRLRARAKRPEKAHVRFGTHEWGAELPVSCGRSDDELRSEHTKRFVYPSS